jgi:hypothetical protein
MPSKEDPPLPHLTLALNRYSPFGQKPALDLHRLEATHFCTELSAPSRIQMYRSAAETPLL